MLAYPDLERLIANGTYLGKKKVGNRECDVWRCYYEQDLGENHSFIELGAISNGSNPAMFCGALVPTVYATIVELSQPPPQPFVRADFDACMLPATDVPPPPKPPPLPPVWPEQFDAEWTLCCEHGTDSWHPGWHDHQAISYDWTARRQSVQHTDMHGMGPGRDWTLPNGDLLFLSDNSTSRFKAPCCLVAAGLGVVSPDWAQRDEPKYMGTEVVNVTSVFQADGEPRLQYAHKWSMPGAMGPHDASYYWQLPNGHHIADSADALRLRPAFWPNRTAQFGASEFGFPRFGYPNISVGFFVISRPITERQQNQELLVLPPQCDKAVECPKPTTV